VEAVAVGVELALLVVIDAGEGSIAEGGRERPAADDWDGSDVMFSIFFFMESKNIFASQWSRLFVRKAAIRTKMQPSSMWLHPP
jgi:hypothetical protein